MKSRILGFVIVMVISQIAILSGLMSENSFAFGKPLKTEVARADEVSGVFTLVLYGGTFVDDLETIAFLDLEGDHYTLEPYAPEFDFTTKRAVPAKEALKMAEEFVSQNSDFQFSMVFKILDPGGVVIGYEVRPFYRPFRYGTSDVLDVEYWLKDNIVKVKIALKPWIERMIFGGGADSRGGASR
jgi:hypothetical protein